MPLAVDPAFRAAADRVEQVLTELRRCDAEIEELRRAARAHGGLMNATALDDATRALAGDDSPQTNERLAALVRRADLMRRALPDAVAARDRAARTASAAYMRGQASRVAAAYERLVQGFEQVSAASDLFEAVRRDADALGFDYAMGGTPAGADLRFREHAQHWMRELRKELSSLRATIG